MISDEKSGMSEAASVGYSLAPCGECGAHVGHREIEKTLPRVAGSPAPPSRCFIACPMSLLAVSHGAYAEALHLAEGWEDKAISLASKLASLEVAIALMGDKLTSAHKFNAGYKILVAKLLGRVIPTGRH